MLWLLLLLVPVAFVLWWFWPRMFPLGAWRPLYEKLIVSQWDFRFRAEYRLFHPKSAFRRQAKTLNYKHIQALEKEVFGYCWHTAEGEVHEYPFVIRDVPPYDDDLRHGFISRQMHYCTDVPDTLKRCDTCDAVHKRNADRRESVNLAEKRSSSRVYAHSVRAKLKDKQFEKEWAKY